MNKDARKMQQLIERHQGAIDAMRRIADNPAFQVFKEFEENAVLSRLREHMAQHEAVIRAAQSPLEELHRSGVLHQALEFYKRIQPVQDMMDNFNARFILPEMPAVEKLMQEFQRSPAAEVMSRYAARAEHIQSAMKAMHTPWLDAQETLRSVTGFVEIQGIGKILGELPAFDDAVCAALRVDLGDWRDKITWTEPLLTDLVARDAFYQDLGFDPSLTGFPAQAFRESVDIAGLRREPPPVVVDYGEPVPPAENDDDEEAFVLTNIAHDWLQRLESHLRKFIDERMTKVYGRDWPKHQLPNGVYDRWIEKRNAAVKMGRQPLPLIAYADFTDYERVICKRDNWQQVFSGYFDRAENIRESFQRLHPIRLDTMHARPIMQSDEILLYAEVRRLTQVIVS